jgi:hypothetical protein
MEWGWVNSTEVALRILAIINSDYGRRHVENIRMHGPKEWTMEVWEAARSYPQVIDYPEEYLPASFPSAELILQFAEHKGLAELLPDIAKMTGAKAVIAAIDNEDVLPRGLVGQLVGWLERMNVAVVTPKPLCSLSETHYWLSRREKISYSDPLIREFAHYFGMPEFKITLDPKTRTITSAEVTRDAVCGCARYVAEHLIGVPADEAEEQAGMLHHHYPCLAAMGVISDYDDTLMHVSGNILRDAVGEQVRPYKQIQYIAPGWRSETTGTSPAESTENPKKKE